MAINKIYVVEKEDIEKYFTVTEQRIFDNLMMNLLTHAIKDGKPVDYLRRYKVVKIDGQNRDEEIYNYHEN